jgi:hypothetical protein
VVRGEGVVRVRGWAVELLLPAYERLPEGVRVGYCAGRSNVHVYAALYAAGCPRLAFLLTDLDPRDRLEEELASWKAWLVRAAKHTRRAVNPLEVAVRWAAGKISAETARELLSKWETVLYEWYVGFLVPAYHLHRLDSDVVEELRGRARKGDLHAVARLAVNAELERLARMAEAGFPDLPRVADRFVDTLGALGRSLNLSFLVEELPEEKMRKWEEMGIGWRDGGIFDVALWRSDLVPEELRQKVLDITLHLLRSLAELLVPIHLHRLDGYIFAYYE